jgi:hypothetical protein
MPITINYAANPKNDRDENLLLPKNQIIYGNNEMNFGRTGDKNAKDYFVKHDYRFAYAGRILHFGFSKEFGKSSPVTDNAVQALKETVTNMHGWLSNNMRGPWYLEDGMSHYVRRHDNSLIIERYDDRALFAKSEYGKMFNKIEQPWGEHELLSLAIIKGLVPAFSEHEDYSTWVWCNEGYKWGHNKVIDGVTYSYIQPECEEVAALIEQNPVQGTYHKAENGLYLCENEDFSIANDWRVNANAIDLYPEGSQTLRSQMDNFPPHGSVIAFKHASIEAEFKKHWADHFQYNETHKFYHCNKEEYPKCPKRKVPPELIEYMHGCGPDPALKL